MANHDAYNNPELEKLFRRYEEAPESHAFAPLADACRKAGRLDEAVEVCRKGLEAHPHYASGHIVLGKCLFDRGEMDAAYDSFERVLRMDAENLVALKFLGTILAERGEMEEARAHFKRILALDPDNDEIIERLGSLEEPEEILDLELIEEEDFEGEAIVLGDEPIETTDELATVTLADIFASQGYADKARMIYSEVLDRDPGNEAVKAKLHALEATNEAVPAQGGTSPWPDRREEHTDERGETWDGGIGDEDEDASGNEAAVGEGDFADETDPPAPAGAAGQPKDRRRNAPRSRQRGDEENEIADEVSLEQFKRWLRNADK